VLPVVSSHEEQLYKSQTSKLPLLPSASCDTEIITMIEHCRSDSTKFNVLSLPRWKCSHILHLYSQRKNTAVSRPRWRVRRDTWRPVCLVLEQTLAAVAACLRAPSPVSLPMCRGLLLRTTILRAGTAEVRERRRRWSTWRTL
jgi:hypothetical protein